MKISRFAVRRPILTIMVSFIVIILGSISLSRLSIDLMPDISPPTLSISAIYENASPEEVEKLITRPIEEAMSALTGLEEVSSRSSEGSARIRMTFVWGTDMEASANEIRDRLDRVHLPDDASSPQLRKFDMANFPILILGATGISDSLRMQRIIDEQVQHRIERLPGVASLDIWGGLEREIQVNLDAAKIKALDLPIDLILRRIREENVAVPAGSMDAGNYEIMIRTQGEYTSLHELEEMIVSLRKGAPVRLKDIAEVKDSHHKISRIVRINGEPGIRMAISKRSGTNTVKVAERVLHEVGLINRDIPYIKISPIIDTSDFIKRSISNVLTALLFGGVLAILVLLFFLRSISSTAIIATAIPISIIATFGLMFFNGLTLNIMTIGGLALGIGMLVDNAIVVLENIYRLRESGLSPEQAAIEGSDEVSAAIIASTLTTLAVFMPLIFVRGMSGIMFVQLSYVVSFALACSLVVALTLVPTLSSRVKNSKNGEPDSVPGKTHGGIYRFLGKIFVHMEDNYRQTLIFSLKHRWIIIISGILIFSGSLLLIPYIGYEFMPQADEGEISISVEMETGTRMDVTDQALRKVEALVKSLVPEIKSMSSYVGGFRSGNSGTIRMRLKKESERTRSSDAIAKDLGKRLQNIPGTSIRIRTSQGLFLMRMLTQETDRMEIEIRGHDLETADALARKVQDRLETVDGITDTQTRSRSGNPEEHIIINRERAADMKLSVSTIADMIKTIVSGTRAGFYREGGDEYDILVQLEETRNADLRDILDLTVTNADGQPVVLRSVVNVESRKGPLNISRIDQERVITVRANVSGRDMGSVVSDVRNAVQDIPVPTGFSIVFGGEYEQQQEAYRELLLNFILAIVLVYMVMASLYESLRDPFVVMFSVPLAAIGVILMLFLSDTTFNVQTFIGCIMLGGIVVNNAILLVDHTNLLIRRDDMPRREAIIEAGRRRLRPILMTATTTVLALIPLALGYGEGGEAQAPLARAVIGGLFSSTVITLVFVPTIYSFFRIKNPAKKEMA